MNVFIVIVSIYLCKIHCHLLCSVHKKIIIFFLFTLGFFIQKFISILEDGEGVTWTGMNNCGAGQKLEVSDENTF